MLKLGNKTTTQRVLRWFSRPARWFKKPLGQLAKPLGQIDGIERPAVYLGIAVVLWRLWVEQKKSRSALGASSGRTHRRRRPSLRMLVQERLNRAAFDRLDDDNPRAGI